MPSSSKLISLLFGRKRLLSRKSSQETEEKRVCECSMLFSLLLPRCSPFDLISWRQVSRELRRLIDAYLATISHLAVRKEALHTTLSTESGVWHRHRSAQVLIRVAQGRATLVVEEQWTGKDVTTVARAMEQFRLQLSSASMDAPIMELMVVALSAMELSRWYAFLCYMKAFPSVNDLHLLYKWTNCKDVYFPQLRQLTVRTTTEQSGHLSRVVDYGVCSKAVFNRCQVERLCVQLLDVCECKGRLNSQICAFRNWAGTIAFDSRYCLQCLGQDEAVLASTETEVHTTHL